MINIFNSNEYNDSVLIYIFSHYSRQEIFWNNFLKNVSFVCWILYCLKASQWLNLLEEFGSKNIKILNFIKFRLMIKIHCDSLYWLLYSRSNLQSLMKNSHHTSYETNDSDWHFSDFVPVFICIRLVYRNSILNYFITFFLHNWGLFLVLFASANTCRVKGQF